MANTRPSSSDWRGAGVGVGGLSLPALHLAVGPTSQRFGAGIHGNIAPDERTRASMDSSNPYGAHRRRQPSVIREKRWAKFDCQHGFQESATSVLAARQVTRGYVGGRFFHPP